MSFAKKIDMILEAKQLERLSINKIEKLLGVDGTIYKAHKADKYPTDPNLVSELVRKLGVRQQWWDTDWESGSKDIFITPVQKEAAIPENALGEPSPEFLRFAEENPHYMIVPTTVLEGEYRLVPKSELDHSKKEYQDKIEIYRIALSGKEDLIQELRKEIREMEERAASRVAAASQKAK